MLADLTTNDWTQLIANVGVPAVILGVLLYVVVKYAPALVAAHLDFVASAKNQLERMLALQEEQARLIRLVADDANGRSNVCRSLRHLAQAAQEYVRGTEKEVVVAPHLAAILEACDE
jgi:hypothetical protein